MMQDDHVTIIEVGARDGLQNERNWVPTDVKLTFLQHLADAGCKEMEITSFVSPKRVPQMSDAEDIACHPFTNRDYVLVPNKKGLERALAVSTHVTPAFFVGASASFQQKNIGMTHTDSFHLIPRLIAEVKDQGRFSRLCVSTAFYCPFEGKMDENQVVDFCIPYVEAGVDELSIADTIGMANPKQVQSLFRKLQHTFPNILLTAHFHDTRKRGLANVFAALESGVRRFDTSIGELGGCPFAPGATGNVATEEVVSLLNDVGMKTGISLEGLSTAYRIVAPVLRRPNPTTYAKLGPYSITPLE